jgi:L-asparaginase
MLPVSGISFDIQSICRKDSTEITDADRDALCAAVRQTTSTRIVVTHGTDTMIETAAYVLQSGAAAGKAVAFTGAMKPERFKDSDAPFNLCAEPLGPPVSAPTTYFARTRATAGVWQSGRPA